jgi:hypothetical protein
LFAKTLVKTPQVDNDPAQGDNQVMKRWDKILIIAILVTAFVGLALTHLGSRIEAASGALAEVVVEVNGSEVLRVPLRANPDRSQYYEVSVPRGIATIEVRDGRVRVLRMPKDVCPLGLCSDTGWIKDSTRPIVCMPNTMVVKIVGKRAIVKTPENGFLKTQTRTDNAVDAVSY